MLTYLRYFNLKTLETMLNYAHQFIKIRLVFHTPYLWNEAGDPNFYFVSETSKSLSVRGRSFKKIYQVDNFRANVLNHVCSGIYYKYLPSTSVWQPSKYLATHVAGAFATWSTRTRYRRNFCPWNRTFLTRTGRLHEENCAATCPLMCFDLKSFLKWASFLFLLKADKQVEYSYKYV